MDGFFKGSRRLAVSLDVTGSAFMKTILSLPAFAAAIAVTACGINQEMPISVVVYPAVKRCTVVQQEKEQEVECMQLGVYLRDTVKVNAERQINVSFSGSDSVPKEDPSIDRVAELIRASGFKDVRAYRFGL
jgi:hypothetical protein